MINARRAHKTPVRIPREMVLKELIMNFSLNKVTLASSAQIINSIIGKINPIKIGKKQKKETNPDFTPLRFISLEVLNVELSLV